MEEKKKKGFIPFRLPKFNNEETKSKEVDSEVPPNRDPPPPPRRGNTNFPPVPPVSRMKPKETNDDNNNYVPPVPRMKPKETNNDKFVPSPNDVPPPPDDVPPPPPIAEPTTVNKIKETIKKPDTPMSEGDVVLVKTTYGQEVKKKREAPKPTNPGVQRLKKDNEDETVDSKIRRGSTSSFVAKTLGYDQGSQHNYVCRIVGCEERKEDGTGGEKTFLIYKIEVVDGSKSWTIFRRYTQFEQLDGKLKKKGVLPKSDKSLPKGKRPKTQTKELFLEERQKGIQDYMDTILCSGEMKNTQYAYNFLGPFQIGDLKNTFQSS